MLVKKPFLLWFFGLGLLIQSCIAPDSLRNYQAGAPLSINQPIPIINPTNIKIQTNDVLDIKVHSQDVLTAAPFNLMPLSGRTSINDPALYQLQGYLVDEKGNIDFPVLGTLHIAGMTKEETKALLLEKLKEYL